MLVSPSVKSFESRHTLRVKPRLVFLQVSFIPLSRSHKKMSKYLIQWFYAKWKVNQLISQWNKKKKSTLLRGPPLLVCFLTNLFKDPDFSNIYFQPSRCFNILIWIPCLSLHAWQELVELKWIWSCLVPARNRKKTSFIFIWMHSGVGKLLEQSKLHLQIGSHQNPRGEYQPWWKYISGISTPF